MTDRVSPAASAAQHRARRRARVADAARLLPLLGVVLFLMPDLILSGADAGEGATAPWLVYLFSAWLLLLVLSFLIGHFYRRDVAPEDGR
ncbi:MAG: hypothetical protein AAF919_02015 [Pseudomonadota bacterium]